jgi:phosphohistidine phosphatase SixA
MPQRLWRVAHTLLLTVALSGCCGQLHQHVAPQPAPLAPPRSAPTYQTSAATRNFVNARMIIIVRHADIDPAEKAREGNATPLLARGQQRAHELAYALRDAGITRIVTSEALRTQQTAAILAANLHLTPENPFAHGGNPAESPGVVEYLARTAKPDDILLLVHHHSVIPSIMTDLGYPHEPAITDATEFDRLYILLPDPATHTYHLLRARYGGNWGPATTGN